jgi:hypothetical protein
MGNHLRARSHITERVVDANGVIRDRQVPTPEQLPGGIGVVTAERTVTVNDVEFDVVGKVRGAALVPGSSVVVLRVLHGVVVLGACEQVTR